MALRFYVGIILYYIKVWLHVSTDYTVILRPFEHAKIKVTIPNIV